MEQNVRDRRTAKRALRVLGRSRFRFFVAFLLRHCVHAAHRLAHTGEALDGRLLHLRCSRIVLIRKKNLVGVPSEPPLIEFANFLFRD